MNRSMLVLAAAAALLLTGTSPAQDFAFSFQGCPQVLEGAAGELKTFDVFATLTTLNNSSPDGAQGWSMSIGISGGTIEKVALKGVIVSTIYCEDDDLDPDTACIQHDGFDFDLLTAFTAIANKATFKDDPSHLGAISAVVMKSQEKMVLQANGTATVLKLSVKATIPDGEAPLTISFIDGFRSSVSQPVNNVVTFGGASVKPVFNNCTVILRKPVPHFNFAVVAPGVSPPASGDSELAFGAPAGDLLVPVDVLLSTSNLPVGGEGPQGWSVSLANDSCMTVDKVTLKGVTVSTVYCQDDDLDPDTACILQDPFSFDLFGAFTTVANKASGEPPSPVNDANVKGVISAVVMKSQEKMVLHANASDTILRIVFRVPVVDGETTSCRVYFVDGMKSSVSQPVKNVITYQGSSQVPTLEQGLVIKITGESIPVANQYRNGDANNDGNFNIADAVRIVMAVVPSLGPPLACPDSGDADGNGRLELPDAILIIDWQFRHGPPPAAPFPDCGTSERSTGFSCPRDSTGCPLVP